MTQVINALGIAELFGVPLKIPRQTGFVRSESAETVLCVEVCMRVCLRGLERVCVAICLCVCVGVFLLIWDAKEFLCVCVYLTVCEMVFDLTLSLSVDIHFFAFYL